MRPSIGWYMRRYSLSVRTLPFQGEETGSTPVSATTYMLAPKFADSDGRIWETGIGGTDTASISWQIVEAQPRFFGRAARDTHADCGHNEKHRPCSDADRFEVECGNHRVLRFGVLEEVSGP